MLLSSSWARPVWARSLSRSAWPSPMSVILTNAGTAHVGEFGGPEKIVEAKGEIIEGLDGRGVAVLNLDDKAFDIWVARAGSRKVHEFCAQKQPC